MINTEAPRGAPGVVPQTGETTELDAVLTLLNSIKEVAVKNRAEAGLIRIQLLGPCLESEPVQEEGDLHFIGVLPMLQKELQYIFNTTAETSLTLSGVRRAIKG
jgi:hypothetical protein